MRKAWFCYEMGSRGPYPVIHYDSLPNQKNSLNPRVLQSHELTPTYFRDHGGGIHDEVTESFYRLVENFPYNGNHYNLED